MTKLFIRKHGCASCANSICDECDSENPNFKHESVVIEFLARVGIVSLRDGKIVWPISIAPRHVWSDWRHLPRYVRFWGYVYLFRNRPGVVKWIPGRLLPRRWGIGFGGLIEIGDRGSL